MMWHETHRARMAAKTLARHRKKAEREPILTKALELARQMNRPDLVGKVEAVRGGR